MNQLLNKRRPNKAKAPKWAELEEEGGEKKSDLILRLCKAPTVKDNISLKRCCINDRYWNQWEI